MTKFRHPYLTRGIVHTPAGAFAVSRGVIDAPDAVGEAHGWLRIKSKEEHIATVATTDSGDGMLQTNARSIAYA